MNEEDARTKQDLLFEVSSLNARLSDEIVKNEQLQNNWNELKKWCKENQYDDNFDSYQVDTYTTYNDVLKKIRELQGDDKN